MFISSKEKNVKIRKLIKMSKKPRLFWHQFWVWKIGKKYPWSILLSTLTNKNYMSSQSILFVKLIYFSTESIVYFFCSCFLTQTEKLQTTKRNGTIRKLKKSPKICIGLEPKTCTFHTSVLSSVSMSKSQCDRNSDLLLTTKQSQLHSCFVIG